MKHHKYLSARGTMKTTDRRRKYPEGEKIVRLTISMSESQYKEILEDAGDTNVSKYIREVLAKSKE
jgi:hypothetical protein